MPPGIGLVMLTRRHQELLRHSPDSPALYHTGKKPPDGPDFLSPYIRFTVVRMPVHRVRSMGLYYEALSQRAHVAHHGLPLSRFGSPIGMG